MSELPTSANGASFEIPATATGWRGIVKARDKAIVGDDDVIDASGAMVMLKLGRSAVYDGCARGQIPHRRIGKLLRFSRAGLHEWLSSSTTISASQRTSRG